MLDFDPTQGNQRFELLDPLEDIYSSVGERECVRALMERADGFADLLILIAGGLRRGAGALGGAVVESAQRCRQTLGRTSAHRVART